MTLHQRTNDKLLIVRAMVPHKEVSYVYIKIAQFSLALIVALIERRPSESEALPRSVSSDLLRRSSGKLSFSISA